MVAYVKTLLPDLPAGATPFVLAFIAIAATTVAAWPLLARANARRRYERNRSWADATLERLERLGERHGRSRRPWETASAYANTLAVSVLPDDRVRRVATLIDADAYAPDVDRGDRAEAERILLELETTAARGR
jgi:hypothetical protein